MTTTYTVFHDGHAEVDNWNSLASYRKWLAMFDETVKFAAHIYVYRDGDSEFVGYELIKGSETDPAVHEMIEYGQANMMSCEI